MKAKMLRAQPSRTRAKLAFAIGAAFVLTLTCTQVFGQSSGQLSVPETKTAPGQSKISLPTPPAFAENARAIWRSTRRDGDEPAPDSDSAKSATPQFRVERIEVQNGADLLTIFGRLDGRSDGGSAAHEIPLISVLRDTLGDNDPENDKLRYVWMLTYTQPSLAKQIAAAIPFLYYHVGNQTHVSKRPAPIIDLANVRRETWNKFLWMGVQNVFLDTYGLPLKASTRNYRRNLADYRHAHVIQALSILSIYEKLRARAQDEGELLAVTRPVAGTDLSRSTGPVNDTTMPLLSAPDDGFSMGEMLELRARLIFSNKTFGGLAGVDMFRSTVEKRETRTIDLRNHNWELLRQRAEAEGLYFDPLVMPDGSATHALLWVAKGDLAAQPDRHFNDRFLNIGNPWRDSRLRAWKGYTQTRYLDSENRVVDKERPGARAVQFIPLALYGLDHPKIPALLIDFRDELNPKKRELSGRILHDVARNILSLSTFGNIPYFLGKTTYDFVTGRRGMDVNQPSRLQGYSELKLLLALNGAIDPKLRREIERRLETVSVNPLSNDTDAELQMAQKQYEALLNYARAADGLPAKLERDRRSEMTSLTHGRATRIFFTAANVLSFGHYVHRETATPELTARMELQRRVRRHSELLQEVARSSPQIDVVWDMNVVRHALQLVSEHGEAANGAAARAVSTIFDRTSDDETRRLCLDSLYKINDKTARNELLRLYRGQLPQSEWKLAIADRLRKAVSEDPRLKPGEIRAYLTELGSP